MSVDKRIDVLKTHKLCNNCLNFDTTHWKCTFKCRIHHNLHDCLIHFNVPKTQIEDSDSTLF